MVSDKRQTKKRASNDALMGSSVQFRKWKAERKGIPEDTNDDDITTSDDEFVRVLGVRFEERLRADSSWMMAMPDFAEAAESVSMVLCRNRGDTIVCVCLWLKGGDEGREEMACGHGWRGCVWRCVDKATCMQDRRK